MSGLAPLLATRLALGLATLFAISLIIFGAVELLPGDIAEELLGQQATEETVAARRRELGLDRPAYIRYLDWLGGAAVGDFGASLANGRPVAELIGGRLGNTLFLAAMAAIMAVPLAIALGLMAALWRNSLFDRGINIVTLSSISFPEFFVAYLLIFWLAQGGLFPSMSNISPGMDFWDRVYRSTLPALTLTLVVTAHMMRMTRAAI
ncbi:MAG: ABC transporter permease, partial [Pseudomonadota bacterium]